MHPAIALIAQAQSGIKLLLPAANELLWGAVSFIALFILLSRFAFPAASKALNERAERIRGDIEFAQHDREEASRLLAEYRQQIAAAREESSRILEEARRTAEQVRSDLKARAEEESARMIERAREDIAGERERAIAEIQREIGSLAVDLASRVIGESLDRERQLSLVDRYIDDLAESGNGAGGGTTG